MNQRIYAVTLLELLIAIVLLSIIVLVISSIDLFSHHQVINSERRVRLQNEASYVLEHMGKEIARAIGNERVNGANSVVSAANIGANQAIRVYIDGDGNGRRNIPAVPGPGTDRWIAYRFTDNIGPVLDRYEIRYCPQCTTATCVTCAAPNAWGTPANILSRRIETFNIIKTLDSDGNLGDNFVEIALTGCWDPDGVPDACGTTANPRVTMRARIKMPSVSTH